MKLDKKSEWFIFDSPLGEPDIKWDKQRWNDKYTKKEPNTYYIERLVNSDGSIIWFGQNLNWLKKINGGWTVLGEDKNVKPTKIYYREDGTIDGVDYPEGRQIWIECDMPIYEKMYIENYEKFKKI